MLGTSRAGRLWAAILFLALIPYSAAAQGNSEVGTSVFQFLQIGVGARPMGMGGAFTAVADDANSIYWNPAGLSLLKLPEGNTNYLSYFSGVNAGGATFAQPVSRRSAVGFSAQFLRVGGIQTTTVANPTGDGLDDFSVKDLALTLAYAGRITSQLSAGGTVKYLYEGISTSSGFATTGAAVDLGLLYRTGFRKTSAGIVVRHLGAQLSAYRFDDESLPITIAGGISTRALSTRLILAVDFEKPRDNDAGVNLGGEFQMVRDFFVRAGYRSLDDRVGDGATSNSDIAGWTFGLGVAGNIRYRFDYAYSSFADLGDAHRFSLSLRFL